MAGSGFIPLGHEPGHVSRTPQPIAGRLLGARRAGQARASAVELGIALHRDYAMQALPRLSAPEAEPTTVTMLRVARAAEIFRGMEPWPGAYREGFRLGSAPKGATG